VKYDVPRLLGFEHASVFLHDEQHGNLYAISIDEDQERRVREIEGTFETEYAIDDSQVIRFPITMGVNGYCFWKDAIAYFNHC